jgi:quercetin dioxygenase-like cupin family protein
MIPASEVFLLESLVMPTPGGIASRVLGKAPGGTVTLFAFDADQGLTEHTSPYDALVQVLTGTLVVAIGGVALRAEAGSIVRLPADIPHAVDAPEPSRMLLTLIR